MSDEDDARRRLAALPGFTAARAARARLTRLAGLTNRVFKVEIDGEPLCLRIPGVGSQSLVDRRVERTNARAAATAGVTPEVLYFGADGAMLTRFVEGAPLTPQRLGESPAALRRAAAALRTLHEDAADFAGTFRVFETMQRYVALLAARGAGPPGRHRETLAAAEAVRAALAARPAALRPCHCDPTGANLIDTGARVWLVDWEYSAMNDPMWDLAYLSVESRLDDDADRALLAAYLRRPAAAPEAARMAATQVACELLGALWALVQEVEGNRAADFRAYAERAFERAAQRMAAAPFAAQLDAIRYG